MPKKDPTYERIERALYKDKDESTNYPFPQGNGNQKTYDVMCQ